MGHHIDFSKKIHERKQTWLVVHVLFTFDFLCFLKRMQPQTQEILCLAVSLRQLFLSLCIIIWLLLSEQVWELSQQNENVSFVSGDVFLIFYTNAAMVEIGPRNKSTKCVLWFLVMAMLGLLAAHLICVPCVPRLTFIAVSISTQWHRSFSMREVRRLEIELNEADLQQKDTRCAKWSACLLTLFSLNFVTRFCVCLQNGWVGDEKP